MTKDKLRNMPASIRQRLLNYGVAAKLDPNLTLLWYAFERLLYRLSVSPYGDRFIVKGANAIRVWGGAEFRATKDLDLLGFIRLHRTQAELDPAKTVTELYFSGSAEQMRANLPQQHWTSLQAAPG